MGDPHKHDGATSMQWKKMTMALNHSHDLTSTLCLVTKLRTKRTAYLQWFQMFLGPGLEVPWTGQVNFPNRDHQALIELQTRTEEEVSAWCCRCLQCLQKINKSVDFKKVEYSPAC